MADFAGILHYLQSDAYTVSFLETTNQAGKLSRTQLLMKLPRPTSPTQQASAATEYFQEVCHLPNCTAITVTGRSVPFGTGGMIAIVFTTCAPCNN
jgi:hypothetical protein